MPHHKLEPGNGLLFGDDPLDKHLADSRLLITLVDDVQIFAINLSRPVEKITVQQVFGVDIPHPVYYGGPTHPRRYICVCTAGQVAKWSQQVNGYYLVNAHPHVFFNEYPPNTFHHHNLRFYFGWYTFQLSWIKEMIDRRKVTLQLTVSKEEIFW